MKRNNVAILFFLVSLLTVSCSKVDRLFNNGKPVTEQRELGHTFNTISMYNNVNVKLIQSDHPHLELTCPENLIDNITTEIEGDTLVIKNENDFNWLRSFDYSIDLTVYYDNLLTINYASIGDLIGLDTLRGFMELSIDSTGLDIDTIPIKTFHLNINEGCGKIDLPFNCDVVKCIFGNGTSEVTLSGTAAYTDIIMRSYGVVHAENLKSIFVRVKSNSTNDAYVYSTNKLTVWLYSIGNVYYRGNPWIVQECEGDGRVIKLE